MLERHGFRAEVLRTRGNPFVYGNLPVPGATRTLLLYGHYDGQPVDSPRWKQKSPFVPILRDGRLEDGAKEVPRFRTLDWFDPQWRLYARSAADNKAPIVALATALDALKASGTALTSNVRVLIDGELESGSPSLDEVLSAHRDKLDADLLVLLDDPMHPGRPSHGRVRRPRQRSPWSSRPMARRSPCTAATTATGCPTRAFASPGCWRR